MIWTTRPRSRAGPITMISQGKGPPVLLIHGVGLRAEAWAGQIDVLATFNYSCGLAGVGVSLGGSRGGKCPPMF